MVLDPVHLQSASKSESPKTKRTSAGVELRNYPNPEHLSL